MQLLGNIIRAEYDPDRNITKITVFDDIEKKELIIPLRNNWRHKLNYDIYWDSVVNQYDFAKRGDKFQNNSIIAQIVEQASTSDFKIKIAQRFEHLVNEYSFVSVEHNGINYVGQIIQLNRNKHNQIEGLISIFENIPKTPFRLGSSIRPANEADIEATMGFKKDGYYLGKLYPSTISVRLPRIIDSSSQSQNNLFNGITVYGQTGYGKTYLKRILVEELVRDCPILDLDFIGDSIYEFQNSDGAFLQERFQRFNVTPVKDFESLFVSMSNKYNQFSKAEILDARTFNSEDLFLNLLLKKGRITTISFKGMPKPLVAEAAANIVNTLLELGLSGRLPPTVVAIDEAHEFAAEGTGNSESKDAFKVLATRKGHANLIPIFMTQRKASISKGVVAPSSNSFVFRMEEADIKQMGYNIKGTYGHLVMNLPKGTCLATGFFNTTLPIEIRPSKTRHFRVPDEITREAKNHPELCEKDIMLQEEIDLIARDMKRQEEKKNG